LRLNGGETLGKYFRTRLEANSKGTLIARVQPIIATYGNPELKLFQSGVRIKQKRSKSKKKLQMPDHATAVLPAAVKRDWSIANLEARYQMKTEVSDDEDAVMQSRVF
jgi:hypothetical protein